MDLRKGSEVKEGKRRCIRCRGRKKLYKIKGGWSLENSGGTLTDCPLCLGVGLIDKAPFAIIEEKIADLKEKEGVKRKAASRGKKLSEHEKEY
jgi:hypothetical protein